MNKKIIIPLVLLVAIIAIIIGTLTLKGKKPDDVDNSNQPSQTDIEIDQKAEDISKDIPGLDKEEVKDILNEKTTIEQDYTFEEALKNIELDKTATFDEEGNMHVTDTEGNDVIVDEHPHQDVIDMTEEEAEESLDDILNELNNYIDKANKDNQNTDQNNNQSTGTDNSNTQDINSGNNQGNEEQSSGNSSQTTEHTGNVWDQEFYDSLGSEADKEQYRNFSDANRMMMQQVIEESRAQGNNESNGNNQSDKEPTAEEYMDSWSNVGSN